MTLYYDDAPGDCEHRVVRCRGCDYMRCTHWPLEQVHHKCPAGPCANLRDEMRQVECQSCAGKVMLKVLGCAVHGECTIAKKIEGVATCLGCRDFLKRAAVI